DCFRGRNRMALAGVVGHRRGGVVVLILVRLRRAAPVQIGGPGNGAVAGQVEVRVVLVGGFVVTHVVASDDVVGVVVDHCAGPRAWFVASYTASVIVDAPMRRSTSPCRACPSPT